MGGERRGAYYLTCLTGKDWWCGDGGPQRTTKDHIVRGNLSIICDEEGRRQWSSARREV